MMKKFHLNKTYKALLSAGLLVLGLSACGGSDGRDGASGENGFIGKDVHDAKTVQARFSSAKLEGNKVTIQFKLTDGNGVKLVGLTKQDGLSFGIAQLTEVSDGNFQWQSYLNKEVKLGTLPEDTSHLTPLESATQAMVESAANCAGDCLVDHGDGSYSYTYQVDIMNVTSPVKVAYNAEFTQRATLELALANGIVVNAHHEWQPATGSTDNIQTRDVVSLDSCHACHQPDSLAFHGGKRIDIENCAACHTATSADPESGNSIEWGYMIHAIHRGEDRKIYVENENDAGEVVGSKIAAPYKIIGYKGSVHDYGTLAYPQNPAADCSACHTTEGENVPANADLFLADNSNQACISCHTLVPKQWHSEDNADCVACHTVGGYGRGAEEAHADAMKPYLSSQKYSAKFSNIQISNNGSKNVLTFDVQILDENGTALSDKHIANPSAYAQSSIYFSWNVDQDYPAYTDGSKYSDRGLKLRNTDYTTYQNGVFSVSSENLSLALPADLDGVNVELYAGVATCFTSGGKGRPVIEATECTVTAGDTDFVTSSDYAYIQSAPLRFKWDGSKTIQEPEAATADKRRLIIDEASCLGCHNQEIEHYDNGVNCQACHTPDKGLNAWGGNVPTSFAYKAHKADGHYLKESGTVLKSDCATCHAVDKSTGELVGITLGRATDRAWQEVNKAGEAVWASSDTGACLTCHRPTDPWFKESTRAHIEGNGGVLDAATKVEALAASQQESCATCHSPERIMASHGHQ
ncbi:OmcA/MtrC family decaheme c-type cytochrome [Ferrimonas senticii]|uniref:OmcA/MtrC family decaheme c-type cytochrome n=1 Tax=Ferrimonas senticii TaxID=394566 RepID=UPI0003F6C1F5|nr:OmcA/MtrC family decaheme c-type cytochrome [Ferrimonas senticii]